jgi:phosphoribosyl 1,2-cyclic phosphate phosphodiesterase
MLEYDGNNIVIDTGPDFRQQMLRQGVAKLDAVLFTHEHRDHVAGLDDIRSFNFIQKQPMDVFAEERVFNALRCEFPYVFAENRYPGAPQVNERLISTDPFHIGSLEIVPVRLMHHKLPILGFRIDDFAYITDANYISDTEKEKLKGVKNLVVNGLRKETHRSHFTLSEAVGFIESLSPENGYITHISHLMGLHSDLQAELPDRVFAAYDGLVLDL